MRKRATDGTKIRTSLSITNTIVSTRRRAEGERSGIGLSEAGEDADEAARAGREQPGGVKRAGGALAGLAAGRVGHDQVGERLDLEVLRDRQRPWLDQVAGVGPQDRGAEDAAVARRHDLDLPLRLAFRLGAVVVREGPAQHPDAVARRGLRRRLGKPYLGQLR